MLVELLLERGATRDDDAFYHACELSNTARLDLLYEPGFETMVNHKLDFEDAVGLRWFLDFGVDVNANHSLHHAISRGRGITIITTLLHAGAGEPALGPLGSRPSPARPGRALRPGRRTSCCRRAARAANR